MGELGLADAKVLRRLLLGDAALLAQQRTQRMGGYTFVVMGIVLLVLAFLGGLLGDIATLIVLLAAVLGGSAWIYLYSYLVYVGKMK